MVCPTPAQPLVFQEYVRAVSEQTKRRQRVAAALPPLVQIWRWAPGVEAIQALRGMQFLAAVTLIAELGDLSSARYQDERKACHSYFFCFARSA